MQQEVALFNEGNEMEMPPEYRLLDFVSGMGEVAKDAAKSTEYGDVPEDLGISSDEIEDVLCSLLALAESVDVDASEALDEALMKYKMRINNHGSRVS